MVQSIDKEWQIGSHLHFIRFFSNLYPNINLEFRQFAKQNITINKIEWSLVTSQNREIKNDKRVGIFSKLQLRIKKNQRK